MEKKKVVVFSGSPRIKDGYRIVEQIKNEMAKTIDVEFDYINVNKLNINHCAGCMKCFNKGEAHCPFDDDIKILRQKLNDADAIIFMSPVYALSITGGMKIAVDRLSYMFHRPELVAKPAITVVTTGGGGINPTRKYLRMIARCFGCNLVGGIDVISPVYFEDGQWHNPKYANRVGRNIRAVAGKLSCVLESDCKPVPSYNDLYMFHGLRSKTHLLEADKRYWEEKNWLTSEYYYDTKLNPIKKLYGKTLDGIINLMIKSYKGKN